MVTIELSQQDAELFRKFRQYQDDFEMMLRHDVFDFKRGNAVIHRDDKGKLRMIEINQVSYGK